jgi:hypothetical protein
MEAAKDGEIERELKARCQRCGQPYEAPDADETTDAQKNRRRNLQQECARKEGSGDDEIEIDQQLKERCQACSHPYVDAEPDESVQDRTRRRQNLRAACTRKEKAAAQNTSRRSAIVNTQAPTLPESEDVPEDVLNGIHPVPEVARAAVCFMKGTERASVSACDACREIRTLHNDNSLELPAVPGCNRIEMGEQWEASRAAPLCRTATCAHPATPSTRRRSGAQATTSRRT